MVWRVMVTKSGKKLGVSISQSAAATLTITAKDNAEAANPHLGVAALLYSSSGAIGKLLTVLSDHGGQTVRPPGKHPVLMLT